MPGAVAHQTSTLDADPQRPVARDGQAEDAVGTECRRVLTLVIAEATAIEAHQSVGGADPQRMVWGFREGLHYIARKPIGCLP